MLIRLLLFNTSHFSISIFSAFAFFSAGLLYFDSWQIDRTKKTPLVRSVGFFMLSLSSAFHSTSSESDTLLAVTYGLYSLGLFLILITLMLEPVLHKPQVSLNTLAIPISIPLFALAILPTHAVLSILIAAWYFRKATEGYEKQLFLAGVAFVFLAITDILTLPQAWIDTQNVFWSRLLAEFSTIWIIEHTVQFFGTAILMYWIWGYIRFRLMIQLFSTIVAATLVIFLTTTVFFSVLLLRNLERDALSHLQTDVNVMHYALGRIEAETLSHAKSVARDTEFRNAFADQDRESLGTILSEFMLSQGTDFLTVVSEQGEVIMRAEDRDRFGDNLAHQPAIAAALENSVVTDTTSDDGVVSPRVKVVAAIPINGGALQTGFIVDNAFVDGIKEVTGLDTTVYGNNVRAATTFIAPDGKSRYVGTFESNDDVLNNVLIDGSTFIGATQVFNEPYYSAYSPIESKTGSVVGMLFVGKPQITLLETTQQLIRLTFMGSVVLIVLSIIPIYFLSRFIKDNLEA